MIPDNINMSGHYKGFIDLQVNGWCGVDFSGPSLTHADFLQASRRILESGTGAFLPTVITSDMSIYETNLPLIARAMQDQEFHGRIPGIHIEGPFISPQDGARGAHPVQSVKDPDIGLLDHLIKLSGNNIKMLTVAAERPGAIELVTYAESRGICVSLGHQLAEEQEINAAAAAGAKALTHLGNGMPATINRHRNPFFAGLACDSLSAMIITDGHHIPDSLIKIILQVKGPGGAVVTSDATALTGMPPGNYEMFGSIVTRDDSGKVYNRETGYLAGSGATILECMNYLASLDLLTESEMIEIGFYNPLRLIGISDIPGVSPPEFDKSLRCFKIT